VRGRKGERKKERMGEREREREREWLRVPGREKECMGVCVCERKRDLYDVRVSGKRTGRELFVTSEPFRLN